jgi:hypothetical protein
MQIEPIDLKDSILIGKYHVGHLMLPVVMRHNVGSTAVQLESISNQS